MLIANDTELRTLLKNAVDTVEGEETLYSKLTPFMEASELWLAQKITGSVTLSADQTKYAKAIVAFDAYHKAIPTLDLILTANGFGVVSNQNVAPASRERVETLRKSMLMIRDTYINNLLTSLFSTAAYQSTNLFRDFTSSMWNRPDCFYSDITPDPVKGLWEYYEEHRTEIEEIEEVIINHGLSRELFNACCLFYATGTHSTLAAVLPHLVRRLCAMISRAYSNTAYAHSGHFRADVRTLVQYIRTTPALYSIWKTTEVGKAWETPTFTNDKSSGGYWF